MSTIYYAGQFNDVYSPKRLGNWEIARTDRRPRYEAKSGPTAIIANERGHLLPGIPRKPQQTAWGCLYNRCVNSCTCPKRVTNSENTNSESSKRKRFPIPSFYKNEKYLKEFIRLRPPRLMVDPFLQYLRHLQLPTVWIIGLPTESIKQKRKQIVQYIANQLNYAYIDLESKVASWIERQRQNALNAHASNNVSSFSTFTGNQSQRLILSDISKSKNSYREYKPIPTYRNYRSRSKSPQSELELSQQLSQSQTQTKSSTSTSTQQSQSLSKRPFGMVTEAEAKDILSFKIAFDTSIAFDTEQILDLLKFAMIEALPCSGYVLDGFPCNLDEASGFERYFYPSALAMHFLPTKVPKLPNLVGAEMNQNQQQQQQKSTSTIHQEDPIAHCRRFRRKCQSLGSLTDEQICDTYGNKVIRVLDTNSVDDDTRTCIYDIVCDNLERYPDIATGNGRVDWKIDYDDTEPEAGTGTEASPSRSTPTPRTQPQPRPKEPLQQQRQPQKQRQPPQPQPQCEVRTVNCDTKRKDKDLRHTKSDAISGSFYKL